MEIKYKTIFKEDDNIPEEEFIKKLDSEELSNLKKMKKELIENKEKMNDNNKDQKKTKGFWKRLFEAISD